MCFNKAGDQPEEWSPLELHLVSLGRNFTGFPAWQNPGGRMCRKAQGPQSLQVRSPASLSPLLASLSLQVDFRSQILLGRKIKYPAKRPTEMAAGISGRWRVLHPLQGREQLTQSPYWGGKVSILKRLNDQCKELPLLCNINAMNDKIFLLPSHALKTSDVPDKRECQTKAPGTVLELWLRKLNRSTFGEAESSFWWDMTKSPLVPDTHTMDRMPEESFCLPAGTSTFNSKFSSS